MKISLPSGIVKSLASVAMILIGFQYADARSVPLLTKNVASDIERALVYQDRVLITRRSESLPLRAGRHEIYFRNLPASLQDESVRAESTGGSNLRILDVEVKLYHLEKVAEKEARALNKKIRELRDRNRRINNSLGVLKFRRSFLHGVRDQYLARSSGDSRIKSSISRSTADYDRMMRYLTGKLVVVLDFVRKERITQRKILARIRFLRKKQRRLRRNRLASVRKKTVKVTLDVRRPTSTRLLVSYINFQVGWKPRYDIRVLPDRKEVRFIGYGIVTQKSGEDWKNTKLSFSTARPAVRTHVPEIKPLYVVSAPGSGASDAGISQRRKAISSGGGSGSLVFNVPRKTNIPADGSPHRTAISRHVFPVKFEYLSIPRLTSHVFLRALGKNSMRHPILRGALNIFMKNDFMGSAYTADILPGEEFELTLNANEKIRVRRTLDEQTSRDAGILSSGRIHKYVYQIKIENYDSKAITINVLDQLPLSKSDDLRVSTAKFSRSPVLQTKKGIMKWRFRMNPGEKKTISYSFTISTPAGKSPAFYMKRKKKIFRRSLRNLEEAVKKSYRKADAKPSRAPSMKKFLY